MTPMGKSKRHSTFALAILLALSNSFSLAARASLKSKFAGSPAADSSGSEMRDVIESYNTDRGSLSRTYPDALSPARRVRFKQFYERWLDTLPKLDFDAMGPDGRIDYLLFKNHLDHELRQLDLQAKQLAEIEPFIPFAKTVFELEETRRRMEPINSTKTAALLTDIAKQVGDVRRALGSGPAGTSQGDDSVDSKATTDVEGKTEKPAPLKVKKNVANRAALTITNLRNTLKSWFDYYNGYDPIFTWWVAEPYKSVDQALQNYASFMSEKGAGVRAVETPLTAADGRPATGRGGTSDPESDQRTGPQRGKSPN